MFVLDDEPSVLSYFNLSEMCLDVWMFQLIVLCVLLCIAGQRFLFLMS